MVGMTFLKNETFVTRGQGSLHNSGELLHERLIRRKSLPTNDYELTMPDHYQELKKFPWLVHTKHNVIFIFTAN